jgi:hypothetical protein
MLVLDSLEQYLKYEVEPPSNLPFHAKYLRIVGKKKQKREDKMTKKMAFVKQLWDRRMDWWRSCVSLLLPPPSFLPPFSRVHFLFAFSVLGFPLLSLFILGLF